MSTLPLPSLHLTSDTTFPAPKGYFYDWTEYHIYCTMCNTRIQDAYTWKESFLDTHFQEVMFRCMSCDNVLTLSSIKVNTVHLNVIHIEDDDFSKVDIL